MDRFIIFAHARSGSTSLTRALNLHPNLRVVEEPFAQKYGQWHPGEKNYIDLIKDEQSLEQVLREIFSSYDGMKILDYQLPEDLYTHMLLLPAYKVILLRRRNLLQAIVSGLIADQTSVWHISDLNEEREELYRTMKPLSLTEIESQLGYQSKIQAYYRDVCARRRPGSVLMVDYEDLYTSDLDKNRAALAQVFRFLEVPPVDPARYDSYLDPGRSKINGASRYNLIPNALEIEERFGNNSTGRLL